jgi:hypothetical protein
MKSTITNQQTIKSEFATKEDVELIVKAATGEVVELLNDVIEQFDKRFNKIEFYQAQHNLEFMKIEKRFDTLDRKYDQLLDTMDAFLKRIDDSETESAARDHKMARIEAWVEAIAKQTGVPMPAVF